MFLTKSIVTFTTITYQMRFSQSRISSVCDFPISYHSFTVCGISYTGSSFYNTIKKEPMSQDTQRCNGIHGYFFSALDSHFCESFFDTLHVLHLNLLLNV